MNRVPRTPLLLGMAGMVPFVWGAATMASDGLSAWGSDLFGPRFVGPYVQLAFGTVVLAFLSGTLWGFALRAEGPVAPGAGVLAVIPAIWAFLLGGGGPVSAAIFLVAGFVGTLGIDWMFWSQGLAPRWWMALRLPLTLAAVLCLLPVVF